MVFQLELVSEKWRGTVYRAPEAPLIFLTSLSLPLNIIGCRLVDFGNRTKLPIPKLGKMIGVPHSILTTFARYQLKLEH